MKRSFLPWLLVLFFAAVAVFMLVRDRGGDLAETRWEYGERGSNADPPAPKKPFDYWFSPGRSIEAESYSDFYHQLGGVGEPVNGEIDVMNALGRDGWELAYKSGDDLIFKRRVRK